jgi:hypothetical protein
MKINRNNYEAYFIDYLEGTLDERLVDQFLEFIKLNPDLKEELALFESVSAVPEDISFAKKDTLYKEKYDSQKEFENAAVAKLEGDLSEKDKFEFNVYLAEHPEKKKEAALFAHTKLKADESVVFAKKNKLYRKPLGKTILLWSGRVAAILVLAFVVFSLINKNSSEVIPVNQLAEVEKVKQSKTETTVQEDKKIPVEEKKKVNPKKAELAPKQELKKEEPEKKPNKSIRETTKGRLEEDVVINRIPLEVPAELKGITASLNVYTPKARMGTMYLEYPDYYPENEMLLADKVKEKFNIGKITKAGLNLAISVSNERFTYATNEQGKVVEYNYDSRLLAFSIPGRNSKPE